MSSRTAAPEGSGVGLPADAHVVLETFQAVEAWAPVPLLDRYHPDMEFSWPPSLPYGGDFALLSMARSLTPEVCSCR
jgi:hypothetical protein